MNVSEENTAVHKSVVIVVNGRKKEWTKNKVTFKEVVIFYAL